MKERRTPILKQNFSLFRWQDHAIRFLADKYNGKNYSRTLRLMISAALIFQAESQHGFKPSHKFTELAETLHKSPDNDTNEGAIEEIHFEAHRAYMHIVESLKKKPS